MAPTVAEARAPIRPPVPLRSGRTEPNPRLRVQQIADNTKRRHLIRAIRRFAVLSALDVALLEVLRVTMEALRELAPAGGVLGMVLPDGLLGGWGTVCAVIVGLMSVGAYNSEHQWASPGVVVRGLALGIALATWQSIDSEGVVPAALHWASLMVWLGMSMVPARVVLKRVVMRFLARPSDRIILVGDPDSEPDRYVAQAILQRHSTHSLGWLSERVGSRDYLGHPSAVWEVLCETGTDTVVVCDDVPPDVFNTVVEAAAVAGCRVLSIRNRGTLMASRPRPLNGGGLRMLELTFPAARAGTDVMKRLFDGIVSATIGLLCLPIMVLIAAWIRIDSKGPAVFVQDRVGQAGRVFSMMKFRTMRDGADEEKLCLGHLNGSGDPRLFKIPNDPRVTRAGRFLRRWSLDELPQLLNVFRGEMSLVGPRPFFESDLAAYDDHHFIRLTVKPGLTGLWQVMGRSEIIDFEEVVTLDREYVERWSFGLDLKILLRTLPAVFRRTGAY